MRKLKKIKPKLPHYIICSFDNVEDRILDLSKLKDKFIDEILNDEKLFKQVKIGEFGQIYWSNAAYIKDLDNKKIPCEYDISPEFAYLNSEPLVTDSLSEINQ